MYKKFLLYVFYTLLLLTTRPGRATILKLATWNVEWLVSQKDTQNFPIPQDVNLRQSADFKMLLHYGGKLQADIIALQEVGSIETLNLIFPKDQYLFYISKDPIAQHTALAVRKNIFKDIKQNSDLTELSRIDRFRPLRSGLDITLYTKQSSMRILVIHLKSGCQDYPLDRPKLKPSCILLKDQQPIIQKWIQNRVKEKQAFIIIGDFNRVVSPQDLFFKSLSNIDLYFPTAYKANPCWEGNYFIDGFIIDPNANKWFLPDSLRVMKYKEQSNDAQNKLSDHCPVSVKLLVP
ncbi:endonuclease/exonuclease/phosphatase family protein [Commensalibacter papalotli (ex Botero et al. 2024)]|uniref:Endonuclease/exonuclease/phosphatase family (ElsH) (PUBMED:15178340) n=1 Tax=Commensalibacter papalotli (ex Botero et al. 2024) TaxID=2972766 RepID=A0ABM9HN96_9PROT|nr:endonuclease/exonuclease/phosphatase family protein [Commensalibacter papalotli (ex Botero et al. 2024)]CAI3936376.1 Metal-dependent hydrolase [Commensalibacter papalotli (ex Botero et al. 2024)]CAI3939296.1 Metal-dependent hydrolase [Commensalibacter papalotli (ex Botero et al. 2024)]